ncbi:hypothetical protein EC915_104413 [Pseudomonas sp. LP_7_YM]|nr:hypothetical protein EC915_104413 [Pseudomonas sp. LP_7_YM]
MSIISMLAHGCEFSGSVVVRRMVVACMVMIGMVVPSVIMFGIVLPTVVMAGVVIRRMLVYRVTHHGVSWDAYCQVNTL